VQIDGLTNPDSENERYTEYGITTIKSDLKKSQITVYQLTPKKRDSKPTLKTGRSIVENQHSS